MAEEAPPDSPHSAQCHHRPRPPVAPGDPPTAPNVAPTSCAKQLFDASGAKCPTGCNRRPEGRCRPTTSPPPARRRAGRPLGRPTLDAPGRPYVPRQRPVGRVEGVGSRGLKGRGREDGGSTRAQGLGGAEGTHRSIHSDCPCPSPRPDLARGCFPPSVFSLPQVVCAIA